MAFLWWSYCVLQTVFSFLLFAIWVFGSLKSKICFLLFVFTMWWKWADSNGQTRCLLAVVESNATATLKCVVPDLPVLQTSYLVLWIAFAANWRNTFAAVLLFHSAYSRRLISDYELCYRDDKVNYLLCRIFWSCWAISYFFFHHQMKEEAAARWYIPCFCFLCAKGMQHMLDWWSTVF